MDLLLPTSYFPSINYFESLNTINTVYIEASEYYRKHSFQNRTEILGANGVLLLTVPIKKKNSKTLVKNIEIANHHWKKKHINSIKSAYGSSPFFIYYFEDIAKIINTNYIFLIDLNSKIIEYFFDELEINTKIEKSNIFKKVYPVEILDFREKIKIQKNMEEYQQVFGSKFISNLSILDLIFNLGPNAKNYINK